MSSEGDLPLVVLAVGLPGAGKSTWFAERGIRPLSSDMVRALIADDEEDQTIHPQVFRALRQLLSARIEVGRPSSYIDATNLFEAQRRPFIELAAARGCSVEALCFETPLEVCLERNRNRSRRVPEEVIRELAESFEPPRLEEGFQRIEIVRGA